MKELTFVLILMVVSTLFAMSSHQNTSQTTSADAYVDALLIVEEWRNRDARDDRYFRENEPPQDRYDECVIEIGTRIIVREWHWATQEDLYHCGTNEGAWLTVTGFYHDESVVECMDSTEFIACAYYFHGNDSGSPCKDFDTIRVDRETFCKWMTWEESE